LIPLWGKTDNIEKTLILQGFFSFFLQFNSANSFANGGKRIAAKRSSSDAKSGFPAWQNEVAKLTFRMAHSHGNSLASADAALGTAQYSRLQRRFLPTCRDRIADFQSAEPRYL